MDVGVTHPLKSFVMMPPAEGRMDLIEAETYVLHRVDIDESQEAAREELRRMVDRGYQTWNALSSPDKSFKSHLDELISQVNQGIEGWGGEEIAVGSLIDIIRAICPLFPFC